MGPFSNNSPQPPAPNNGSKLPVPDINGVPQDVFVSTEPNDSLAAKKWFLVTLISAGVMAAAGLIVFIIYIVVSNTNGYILNAAMQNLVTSDGEAGIFRYDKTRGSTNNSVSGTFLAYSDPTNRVNHSVTLSAGQAASRVSSTIRMFADSSYIQFAGLENAGRLITSGGGDSTAYNADRSLRLGTLDGQWFTFTPDDIFDLRDVLPRQVQGGLTSKDIDTLRQLYLKHAFVISTQQLNDEKIDGAQTLHVKLGVDTAKFSGFLTAVKSANIKAIRLTDEDLKSIQTSPLLGTTSIEAWIARSDRTFRQIRFDRPGTGTAQTLTITFRSEQAAAQRQTVIRPEDAKTATNLIRGIQDILASPTAPTAAQ